MINIIFHVAIYILVCYLAHMVIECSKKEENNQKEEEKLFKELEELLDNKYNETNEKSVCLKTAVEQNTELKKALIYLNKKR